MRWPGSLAMTAAGVVVALAVTWRPAHVDIQAAGWMLAVGGVIGLSIGLIGQRRHAPWQAWHASGPWLVAIGGIGWLALGQVGVPDVDIPTVGFILLLTGAGLSVGALCQVSGWRLREVLRGYWDSEGTGPETTSMPTTDNRSGYRRSSSTRDQSAPPADDRTQVLPRWPDRDRGDGPGNPTGSG